MNLTRANREVKALLSRTFPEYTGRKIHLEQSNRYYMADYWDGGTRYYARAYNLATGETMPTPSLATNPFHQEAHQVVDIPDGFAIVDHCYFCGKDLGIRVYVNDATFPKLITEGGLGAK